MAGGTFDRSVGKVRPGTYVNFIDNDKSPVTGSERGTVLIPLANTDYGPAGAVIILSAGGIDAAKDLLGHSVYDENVPNMLLIREAFKGANLVVAYICTDGTAKASGTGGNVVGTAKYKGTRGNALKFAILANAVSGFDFEIYLDGTRVELFEKITNLSGITSKWIDFAMESGKSEIAAVAGVSLTGGTSGTTQNGDVTAFLDASEGIAFNTMCFPFTEAALQTACKTKVKYLKERVGRTVQAVIPSFAGDYEGVINVTNSYANGDEELTTAQACAFVAGITAGASNVESNTHRIVEGATRVIGTKTNEEAEAAIKAGQFFFSLDEAGNVCVESDINSLVTLTSKKGKHYQKNRVIRVLDTFQDTIQANFPPNRFDNDEDGWDIMEGIGKAILKSFGPRSEGGIGAIRNIDEETDFLVDRTLSEGDSTYFNVGIQPVDSAEKLYFTVNTR